MSNEKWKYPKWQSEFEEAIVEIDSEKLVEKIKKFELAIFMRLGELSSNDHHDERQAIADALSTLREIKKDKLSYPDWEMKQ